MSSPTLRNIIIVVFIVALIPLVIVPFYNKQKDIRSNISKYEDLLTGVSTEDEDIYEKYMASVLGTYDERLPKDEYIQSMLEDVDDIVDEYDTSGLDRIEADESLPKVRVGKRISLDLGMDSKIEVEGDGSLVYKGEKISDVVVIDGRFSLYVFNDKKLDYPLLIVESSENEMIVFVLIDGELVKYDGVLKSNLNLDVYIDNGKEYILTYYSDTSLEGKQIILWFIDHSKREIVRGESVIEIGK